MQRSERLQLLAQRSELLQTRQSKGLEKEAEFLQRKHLAEPAKFLQRKHLIAEPRGNIYTGWALGVAIPSPRLVGLTVLAMVAQFLAHLISLIWSLQLLRKMKAVHLCEMDEAKLWDWEEIMRKTWVSFLHHWLS